MSQILVTGATGFIGRAVVDYFLEIPGCNVAGVSRSAQVSEPHHTAMRIRPASESGPRAVMHAIPALNDLTDWSQSLKDVDVVIHAAARAHILQREAADALACYRQVNTQGTLHLAREAARAGVRRLVFLSSIGVHGNRQMRAFSENDTPSPHSPYALSKWEAEQGLAEIGRQTGLEIVIIRPPLVYGPDAPGNFGRLMRLVRSGCPLPLASIENRRSLVGRDNLVHFIEWCSRVPQAAQQTFVVSDGEDVSTPELIRRMASAMARPARLLPFPLPWLRWGAAWAGRDGLFEQLAGDLAVNPTKARQLGWTPPLTLAEGLARAVRRPTDRSPPL